ncbi:Signal recognition particle, subunit Ffh SRP54 (TC 3.A.5.1.1) [Richelia intracellularis HM01]|nr:Signal recognition particle, subunit Ffh SRP54 (TC 3.A.5.1.1) [Richelia intracellularis HM01]
MGQGDLSKIPGMLGNRMSNNSIVGTGNTRAPGWRGYNSNVRPKKKPKKKKGFGNL